MVFYWTQVAKFMHITRAKRTFDSSVRVCGAIGDSAQQLAATTRNLKKKKKLKLIREEKSVAVLVRFISKMWPRVN